MTAEDKISKRAVIQLTDACNNRSSYSHVVGKGEFAGLKELAKTLLALRVRGMEIIEFAGGEPTLWPHLPQAVALARKIGFRTVLLNTNGRRLASPAYTDALVQAGLGAVVFIMPAHRSAVYAGITSTGPEAFGQALAGLRNIMRHKGVERGLILPVTEKLADDLEDAVRFFSEFKFSFITLSFDAPYDLLGGGKRRDLAEKHRLLPRILAVLPRLSGLGRIIMEGVQPCLLGRFADMALNEIFRNPGLLVRKGGADITVLPDTYTLLGAKTAACRGCRYSNRCPGFFAGDLGHAPGASAPYSAALDLQHGPCDYRCGFCSRNRDGIRFNKLDVKKYFARPHRGAMHAYFSSSSAFTENLNIWGRDRVDMFPKIHAIITQARECGFRRVTLWNTGLRLADRKKLVGLAKAGLTGFEIPLYGASAAVHDGVTATPGAFTRIMRGLAELSDFGKLRADFHTVVLRANAPVLPDIVQLLAKRSPGSRLALWHYYLDEPPNLRESRRYAAHLPDYKTLIAACSGLKPPLSLEVQTVLFPKCVAGQLQGGEARRGSILPAFALLICDERGVSHKSVTNVEFRERHIRACHSCPERQECSGVMDDYLKVYGTSSIKAPVRR